MSAAQMEDRLGANSNEALLLLDFQYDFLDPKGRLPIAKNQVHSVIDAAANLITAAQRKNVMIIMIGNEFDRSQVVGNFFRHNAAIKGSSGAAWSDLLLVSEAPYIYKKKSDAFSNPTLESLLQERNIKTVTLAGVFAKACIYATASTALQQGFNVKVFAGAVGCKTNRSREKALRRLSSQGAILIQAL